MEYLKQLKEVTFSVLPIVLIASILGFVFGAFIEVSFIQFVFSALLVIVGLSLFLLGVNMGFIPVGNHLGAMVTKKRNIPLLIFVGIALGAIVTLAEPDVNVLATQVHAINRNVSTTILVLVIALGVGIFMSLSHIRALSRFSLKWTMAIGVFLMLSLGLLLTEFFASVGFDSGGATTGPLAVPFIIALGMGVSSVHGNREEDSFGFTGIASLGPVIAVLIYGLFVKNGETTSIINGVDSETLAHIFLSVLKGVTSSILPIVIICVLVEVFSMKLPKISASRIFIGIIYAFIGIVIFLFGVESSFMPVAKKLGALIAMSSPALLIVLGLLFGASVVLAEPAIWVLTEEVEETSEGRVKRGIMLLFISVGVAVAVALSMIRIITGLPIMAFLLPLYGVILLLLPFVPALFVGIGFDSGGVATGPMTSTFLLPFASGAASIIASDPVSMAFGMIGLIAAMPILAIEILGIIYSVKTNKKRGDK